MISQTVFISSRLDELEEERKKVEDGINGHCPRIDRIIYII